MELEQLLKLVKAVSDSNLTGFKYEEKGVKISMQAEEVQYVPASQAAPVSIPVQAVVQAEAAPAVLAAEPAEEQAGNVMNSPLVGTFYEASSEDAEAYVKVGDSVKKGQTLAIVEAMKLMNEIECEYDGTIAEIYAQNGEVVEYGQPLFRIV